MKLSEHVSLVEFERSESATKHSILNKMNESETAKAKLLCEKVFEPIRKKVGKPIKINSGFRSVLLNKVIGGSKSSQHCKGEAMDLDLHDKELFVWIIENVDFDQAIFEGGTEIQAGWFHISYKASGNRKEALRMTKVKGKSVYTKFIK